MCVCVQNVIQSSLSANIANEHGGRVSNVPMYTDMVCDEISLQFGHHLLHINSQLLAIVGWCSAETKPGIWRMNTQ